ncbi:MAG: type II CRISPR-associated endonuclease Cas1 [Chitinophagales bacterium]
MIKRTLYFGNPAHLYMRHDQLCISISKGKETDDETKVVTIPIEDIGVIIIDHPQITFTHTIVSRLTEANAAFITCDEQHHPIGLMLPLDRNNTFTEKLRSQLEATEPLKKQLWTQTVQAKLKNQRALLLREGHTDAAEWVTSFIKSVKSGDGDNHEARGAAIYWQHIFSKFPGALNGVGTFKRERTGIAPNSVLNYGYAIVRAVIARSLVGSGMLPAIGIFHRNKYNGYCLADDIMEPYRQYVDQLVIHLIKSGLPYDALTKEIKEKLLRIPDMDVKIGGENSKLMVAAQKTTSSLMKCFEGEERKIVFPEL